MGGTAPICPFCRKELHNVKDHARAKHPASYREWVDHGQLPYWRYTEAGELRHNVGDDQQEMRNLAARCAVLVDRAKETLGTDLGGWSELDLVADNLPGYSLAVLKRALAMAGFTKYGA